MAFYLGIDGGGTKTACVLGDEAALLETATTGPCNVTRVGEAVARESLHLAVRQVCTAAGITPAQVSRTCIGAAGAAREQSREIVRRILAELLSTEICVVGDMQIALEAAFGPGPGVVVIAGTGSIVYGRNRQGRTARAGGWGFAISDEGSAHWIGRAALAAFLRDQDQSALIEAAVVDKSAVEPEERHPLLREAWLRARGVNTIEDLARTVNAQPSNDFSALFPGVLRAADAGDALALGILSQAGGELVTLAQIVIRKLFPQPGSSTKSAPRNKVVPVAMVGGVFRHAALVRDTFSRRLHDLHPGIALTPEVVEPVHGALRLARAFQQT